MGLKERWRKKWRPGEVSPSKGTDTSRSNTPAPTQKGQARQPSPPLAAGNNLWLRAEQTLRDNDELRKILDASCEILESNYGLKFQPGNTSHHQKLCDFLETKASELEEKKWVVQLGNHTVTVRDKLTEVFKNVLVIKDVVKTAASASPPAGIACAGITACFSLVVEAAEQHDTLLQGLASTSALMPRLRVMEDLYLNCRTKEALGLIPEFQKTLVSLYSKILEFQARALYYLHKNSASQLLRSAFNRDEWKQILADFERLQNDMGRFTSLIDNAKLTQRLEEIQNTLRNQEIWNTTSDRDQKIKKFLKLLYTCPYKDRKDRNDERIPGTCEWFTNHRLFQDWEQSDSSRLLWVSADPGCGKSVLTKYLVDELLLSTDKRTVCYFFFKDDFSDQRSATSALSVILRQIFIAQPQLLQDSVLDKLDTDGDKLVQSFSELWNSLISASSKHSSGEIICIFDALDECQDSERNQLIKAVKDLYLNKHQNGKLKFLLTSRPYDHIRRGFWELEDKMPTIHLSGEGEEEVEKISHEINLVIKKRANDISNKNLLTEEERNLLVQQLTTVENRTYLWVSLVMDVINNMTGFSTGNIRRVIGQLPKTVDEAYNKILDRSSDPDRAKTLLHIVTAAMRPLSLGELSLALAISMSDRSPLNIKDELEPDERFHVTLRNLCGLFVVVIDAKVYLLHQTAKEFLVCNSDSTGSKPISQVPTWKHSLLPEDSNRILATICTFYLILDRTGLSQNDFLEYSSKYWITHFRQTGEQDQNPLVERANGICDPSSDIYNVWSEIYGKMNLPSNATSLLIASNLGLIAVVRLLLSTGKVDVDSKSISSRTPLSYTAENGHEEVVRLLLSTGKVDVGSEDEDGRTPLSWAADNGHEKVVNLLQKSNELHG